MYTRQQHAEFGICTGRSKRNEEKVGRLLDVVHQPALTIFSDLKPIADVGTYIFRDGFRMYYYFLWVFSNDLPGMMPQVCCLEVDRNSKQFATSPAGAEIAVYFVHMLIDDDGAYLP
ncbi:unnamed protein product [Larinioides sclopetarius]|uniref:Uncharacterized protein n=1 Tax=Larinioides sclopetarius TaxID=280406 RepID=A0AAV1Z8G7_9ARAC